MKSNHTKGNWKVANDAENFVMTENSFHYAICECFFESNGLSKKEANANAKLISAAPDMLEALEMAMYEVRDWHEYNYNQIESFDNNGTNNERDMQVDITNCIYEKLQTIKSAIKKATI